MPGAIYFFEHEDGTYNITLKRWFELGKVNMAPEIERQKSGQNQFLTAKLHT